MQKNTLHLYKLIHGDWCLISDGVWIQIASFYIKNKSKRNLGSENDETKTLRR